MFGFLDFIMILENKSETSIVVLLNKFNYIIKHKVSYDCLNYAN